MTDENQPPVPPQQPAPPAAPQYQAAPPVTPQYQGAPASVPGKTLGIVGLILAFLAPLIGLILSIVAKVQSRKAGVPNGIATAGMIVGAILTAIGIIVTIIAIAGAVALVGQCADLGPGVHDVDGVRYTCS